MTDSHRLDGRVAVVTGGAQGIGAAIVDRLSAAGATVVVGDLSVADDTATARRLDVTDEVSVETFLTGVVGDHGGLDIVVNNAGVMFEEPLEGHSTDAWHAMVAVNLTGPFLMTKHKKTASRTKQKQHSTFVSSCMH